MVTLNSSSKLLIAAAMEDCEMLRCCAALAMLRSRAAVTT